MPITLPVTAEEQNPIGMLESAGSLNQPPIPDPAVKQGVPDVSTHNRCGLLLSKWHQ
jgi:hypothetical protein